MGHGVESLTIVIRRGTQNAIKGAFRSNLEAHYLENRKVDNMRNFNTTEHRFLRHGIVVKTAEDGSALVGNGTHMSNYATKIKECMNILSPEILNNTKCLELNGHYAKKDDSKEVGKHVKGMINQFGADVEEFRLQQIDIDIEGMFMVTGHCHKLTDLHLNKSAVKHVLKHSVDKYYWVSMKRNHSVERIAFVECELGSLLLLVTLLCKSKKDSTKMVIDITKPQMLVDQDNIDAFEALIKECFLPVKGRSLTMCPVEWNRALKVKIASIEVGEKDSESVQERKKYFLGKATMIWETLDVIESRNIQRAKVKGALRLLSKEGRSFKCLKDLLTKNMHQVDQFLATKSKKKKQHQPPSGNGEFQQDRSVNSIKSQTWKDNLHCTLENHWELFLPLMTRSDSTRQVDPSSVTLRRPLHWRLQNQTVSANRPCISP